MFVGTIIEQCLAGRAVLDLVDVISTITVDVPHAVAGQPAQWTLTEFQTDEPDVVAERLARDLLRGPWYVDFQDDIEVFVVFHQRVIRYDHGDTDALHAAREYARSVGVPESQLDWTRRESVVAGTTLRLPDRQHGTSRATQTPSRSTPCRTATRAR
jgi:hypothetical protein